MKARLKLTEGARVPEYATEGSACFDIYATSVKQVHENVYEYSTGLYFEIPAGHVMMIYSRSGQGFIYQTRLSNCVGVVDSDYRGELKVQLLIDVVYTYSGTIITHERSDPRDLSKAIAQGMIIPIDQVEFEASDVLSGTERGSGGFGSTDKGSK